MNDARFWSGFLLRLLVIFLLADISPARANEFPLLAGTLALEVNDRAWLRGANNGQRNDLYGYAEADVSLRMSEWVSIRAVATFEPLTDPYPQDDRTFQNEDVRWKDLFIQYDDGVVGFRGGRITANFGLAWYGAPGLDATTLAEDYAIWDRMGISSWYRLNSDTFGSTTFGASAFRMDTSSLSTSWLDTRHRRTRAQGGPSNTAFPASLAFSLYGTDIPKLPGVSWYVAVLRQKVDFRTGSSGQREDSVADEKGAVANIQKTIFLTDRLESISIGEVAYLKDRGGVPGATGHYVTVGETLRFGQWHGQAAFTTRRLEGATSGSSRDTLLGLTAGFDFTNRLSLDAVWRQVSFFDATDEFIRVRLRYLLSF